MRKIVAKAVTAACNERGAEMVEWIVVLAVLATVAAIMFGPGGVLTNAMNAGISRLSNIITNSSYSVLTAPATRAAVSTSS